MAQAQQQASLNCQSHAVAGGAEIVAVGGDEADATVGMILEAYIAGGAAALFSGIEQAVASGDLRAHFIAGAVAFATVATDVAQWHLLDESNVQPACHGEVDQIE